MSGPRQLRVEFHQEMEELRADHDPSSLGAMTSETVGEGTGRSWTATCTPPRS